MEKFRIIGIAGSLRKGSYNRALLLAAQELKPDELQIEVVEIGDFPLYSTDLEIEDFPKVVTKVKEKIAKTDGLLIATPEYNYSTSGVLKNALDWVSRPEGEPKVLKDKPVAVMGASTGAIGTARAQMHLRQIMLHDGAIVMPKPQILVGKAEEEFDESGTLVDEATRERLKTFLEAFASWIRKLS